MYFDVVSRQVLTVDYEQKLRCLYRNHATFTQASRVLSVTEIVLQSMGDTRNLKLRGNVGARARIQEGNGNQRLGPVGQMSTSFIRRNHS